MDYSVIAENISKNYGRTLAVDDISFKVTEGEFFSFLGPSGCGKTTILRILGGFIVQDKGRVEIAGKDMKNIPPNKRDTSMVFQNLALFPHMDVRENIVYGLRKRKIQARTIDMELDKILEIINLKGYEKRKINELSGGQQQRVALARSLIIKPKILLLDEPLASLDKKLRISMQAELKQIQRKIGTTFIYVTHDQGEALTMSDTIVVMNEGKIIQSGTPERIYNCPNSIFVADFIGSGNFIPVSPVSSVSTVSAGNNSKNNILILKVNDGKNILLDNVFNKNHGEIKSLPEASLSCRGFTLPVFFIRPEKIKVSQTVVRNKNCYPGIIKAITFEGPDIKLYVQSHGIGNIKIEIKNDGSAYDFKEGQSLFFHWDYDEGLLLEH